MLVVVSGAIGIALNIGGVRDRFWVSPPLFDSIAVLPLDNTSGEADQAYLAGGIHERLTTELAKLGGFSKVIGTASTRRLRNSNATPTEIARSLGVRALVTGSVMRTGDRVKITAQLVDGTDGRAVWGQTYERAAGDLVSLQNDVVTAIAQAVQLRLRPVDRERLVARASVSPETYELYLRGMHELNSADDGGTPAAGIAYLQKAVDRDPGDPYAYAGMARGYVTQGHSPAASGDVWIRARAAAERALTLAPDLAEAHAAMAQVKLYYEWDWAGAERAFLRANELNPNLPGAHYDYAWQLFLLDRLDEAIVEHERARDIDPLTPRNTAYLSVLYTAARRYDDAIAAAKQVLEQYPRSGIAWEALAFAYSSMGRHDEAIAASQRAAEVRASADVFAGHHLRHGRPQRRGPRRAGDDQEAPADLVQHVGARHGPHVSRRYRRVLHGDRVRAPPCVRAVGPRRAGDDPSQGRSPLRAVVRSPEAPSARALTQLHALTTPTVVHVRPARLDTGRRLTVNAPDRPGASEIGLTIGQPVEPAVDAAGDFPDVVAVGRDVEPS